MDGWRGVTRRLVAGGLILCLSGCSCGTGTGQLTIAEAERSEAAVWSSRSSCQAAVQSGGRLTRVAPPSIRLGTWNLRWFPRGCSPEEACPELATDVAWMACVVAWLDVDLLAIQEVLESSGIRIRAGLHIGECELMGPKVGGIAVHIGARIMSKAEAGETLVSRTVKDLVAGSGIGFREKGNYTLKGVAGEWELFAAS